MLATSETDNLEKNHAGNGKIIGSNGTIEISGARVHNLKNISLSIPAHRLVVFTGLSGSGKSTLAFDTICAEGQRRYMETFPAYARQFLGTLEKPEVDSISGLNPVISIEQKSAGRNPRSTVGTVTEIYDFLRLLFARVSDAYSHSTGAKMIRFTSDQIIENIANEFSGKEIILLAPLVRGRKGHYRELFQQLAKRGFLKVRIDGEMKEITFRLQSDRFITHDIEVVIDRMVPSDQNHKRLSDSVQLALKTGKGTILVIRENSHNDGKGKQQRAKDSVRFYSRNLMCPVTGISYADPEPNTFSFNSPYGACPRCNGIGTVPDIDLKKIIPDDHLSIRQGGIVPLKTSYITTVVRQIEALGEKYGYTLDTPLKDIPGKGLNAVLYGTDEIIRIKNVSMVGSVEIESGEYQLNFEGIINILKRQMEELPSPSIAAWVETFMREVICSDCNGSLNRQLIAGDLLAEIIKRIRFLTDVGLGYLSLNRSLYSLSGGEAQRIRLAAQVGIQLNDILCILDEPSIGLHQRDNARLIGSMKKLRDSGNSVIVVEHDKQMILSADYIVDLGSGAGTNGGNIVASGIPEKFLASGTLTAQYLTGHKQIPVPAERRKGNGDNLILFNAAGNNLKNITVTFPLGTFICVTGVSGSGKSSLINETLFPAIAGLFAGKKINTLTYDRITGIDKIDKVIEIDQSPIGRTPRSNPATYTGLFNEIRNLFSQLPEAKIRGYKPGRFSFNVKGGRCEGCGGAGVKIIQMNFLPDVHIRCDACGGKRYNRETLEARFKGKSINDVLNLPIDEALTFFEGIPQITGKLRTLAEVGLGYVNLGQPSTTLSGGEAQRIKLAAELSRRSTGRTFYILDEPTTGLHFEDVRLLLLVLDKLVDKGNSVLVIEHNMEVIKTADYIIDLGPDGGSRGGEVVIAGTPEEVARCSNSFTGQYLREELPAMGTSKFKLKIQTSKINK
ncbi:MAG: excinuclease ABC subunit UvrA [Bacteroidetes bacterium]|nr:excinuclease ABC subunit UvrA [Bacteroidota bacterium]